MDPSPQGEARAPAGGSDRSYRLLFDGHPLPMWVYDTDTLRFLAVNRAALDSYGYTEAEFLALGVLDLRPPEDRERMLGVLAEPRPAIVTGLQWQHVRRSGERFDVEVSSEAIEFGGRAARLVVAKDITLRKRAEARLAASERRYRDIVETAAEGIWTIDAEGVTTFVNPKMADMLGYLPEDMIGRPVGEFVHDQDAALLAHNIERRRQGLTEQHEFRFRKRDGSALWTSLSTNPVFDDEGAYAGALAMATDISARVQADQQLRLLASSLARMNDIVIITEAEPLDEPGPRILFVNDAFVKRTGYSRDEVIGRSPRLLQGPDTDPVELHRMRQALGRWEAVRSQVLNYTKDGTPFWLELDIVPIADDNGWYTHWVAVEHDITERKLQEVRDASRDRVLTQIAASAPLSTLLETIVLGIEAAQCHVLCSVLLLDSSGRHLVLGAAPSLPADYNAAIDPFEIGPMAGSCGTAAYRGERVIVDDIAADPKWAIAREVAQKAGLAACWSEPILSRDGTVLGTFGVYSRQPHWPDANELAIVAEAAKLAAIAIEHKHAEEALRESQKLESLGTLAGGIAHDFNNILAAILANVSMANQAGALDQTTQARIEQIQHSALRARDLVKQILTFSRRQPRVTVRQPLRPLVEEALALLRSSLPAGVWLKTELSDEPLEVDVDATQIHQVVMNLCTNAAQAMADRRGPIEVGLGLRLPEDEHADNRWGPEPCCAHLWVKDTGVGMDEVTRRHAFDPFFTTKPVGSGTGLGLAVAHGIVAEHRGRIAIESTPGVGSTFHVILPLASEVSRAPVTSALCRTVPGAPAQPPRPSAAAASKMDPRTRPHVLLIDDDEVMRLTGEALLASFGYRVSTVADARKALELLVPPSTVDLVVCDYNMPEMNGIDFASIAASTAPGVPVVICSGCITPELRTQADSVGVCAIVRKEHVVEELDNTIRRVLDEPSALESLAVPVG